MVLPRFLQKARQWLLKTPERSLDQAYEAARMIEAIETEHFDGNPISSRYGNLGPERPAVLSGGAAKVSQPD
jgi:hypothetical protein